MGVDMLASVLALLVQLAPYEPEIAALVSLIVKLAEGGALPGGLNERVRTYLPDGVTPIELSEADLKRALAALVVSPK